MTDFEEGDTFSSSEMLEIGKQMSDLSDILDTKVNAYNQEATVGDILHQLHEQELIEDKFGMILEMGLQEGSLEATEVQHGI